MTIRTKARITAAAFVLSLGLGVGITGCALARPLTSTAPSRDQVQKIREKAIRTADQTAAALAMAEAAVKAADIAERAGLLSPVALRAMANGLIVFSAAADRGLVALGSVTTEPGLRSTTIAILSNLDPLLDAMERSGNDAAKQAAGYIRIATAVARTFAN